jgi:hypothetical protein
MVMQRSQTVHPATAGAARPPVDATLAALVCAGWQEEDALSQVALIYGEDVVARLRRGLADDPLDGPEAEPPVPLAPAPESALAALLEELAVQEEPDHAICLLDQTAALDPALAMAGFLAWGAGRRIPGDLNLHDRAWLTALPERMAVEGCLNLWDCGHLAELPAGLSVGADLTLRGCRKLAVLPPDLAVGGTLDLQNCSGLTDLPDGLSVPGSLNLNGCAALAMLPSNLAVGGCLKLHGCALVRRLPWSLSVAHGLVLNGHQYVADTDSERMPKGSCPLSFLDDDELIAQAPNVAGPISRI